MKSSLFEEMQNAEEYGAFLTARYADMSGDAVEAASYYRRSYERSPNDPSALELATLATLVAAETDEGVELATKADPQVAAASPTSQFVIAIEDIVQGRNAKALQRLRNGDIGAVNQDAQGFLLAWLTAEKDVDGALAQVEQQYTRRALAGELTSLKALILMNAGRDKEALLAFDQASRLPVGAPGYLVSIRARLMAANGDVAGARKLIALNMEEEEGATSESDYILALLDKGKPVERPKLSVRQGAGLAVYLATAGRVARFNADLAIMRYGLALRLDPDLVPARLAMADSLDERGRGQDGVTVLAAIPTSSPWNAEARIKEAWLLNGLDRPAEALAAADAALAVSRRREIVVGAADLFRVNKNNSRAEALYSELIKADAATNTHDWRTLFMRANVREAAGNWKDAEVDLQAALAIEPDRAEIQNFLGYGWVSRGLKVEEGLALIRKAVAARPDQGYMLDSLGWANFTIGKYDDAVVSLEQAAELSPSDSEIVEHLGDAYWRAGRTNDAAFEWRRALELKPAVEREDGLKVKIARGLPALPASLAAAGGKAPVDKSPQ
ncbi:MAG TPA: tetratricopeptide repeat protein [Hyphomonadaceae bacterium]|jgi:tetratricopeptide (TPR) repeat protein|nr:tetratricopeptide repeat protein [Hyphomonadaceae bacterium]